MRAFLDSRAAGVNWERVGAPSAGNGALMRIAPVVLPHLAQPSEALWADAALAGAVTHRDVASIASCVAFVDLLWGGLLGTGAPPEGGFLRRFVKVAEVIEGPTPRYRLRMPHLPDGEVTLAGFTREVVQRALEEGTPTVEACNRWGSGAYLLETVPSVLLILERHAAAPEEALVRAVNDTWDNDTVGAIVVAAVGAMHGAAALPRRWREGLLGRTREADDGRVFELVEAARVRFNP